jgi:sigma-B regulation protein RsbU (phosphoserine phosphatase)
MLLGILSISFRAERLLRQEAQSHLEDEAQELANSVNKWEENQSLALRNLSRQPDILRLNAERQKPILTSMASLYKHITITTVDLNGRVVASSATLKEATDYSDRDWFKGAVAGKEITRETLINPTTGRTEQCFSTPILGKPAPPIIGVIVICTELTEVAKEVHGIDLGERGHGFLVNNSGTAIAHPDPKVTAQLQDLSKSPPVQAVLEEKKEGYFIFTDDQTGSKWLSYLIPLENGWGVVVQQQEKEVLQEAIVFGQLVTTIGAIAVVVVGTFTWLLTSRLTRPLAELTAASYAMSSGNLNCKVRIERQDELGTLAQSFNSMAEQLQELIDIRIKSAMAHSELEKGRQIQKDFLPERLPQPKGWELAVLFEPAGEVAGDFYDAFPLGKGKVGVVIADVCDKGVGSALFMALFRSLLRAVAQQKYASEATALKNAIEFTSNYIATNHWRTNMFATIFFGVLDPATGVLNYINGGHEPPVIISPTGVKTRLKPTGPAVGILTGIRFKVEQAQLMPGDTLVAYTDGVTEARSPKDQFFTEKQLLSLLSPPTISATTLLAMLQASLKRHISTAAQFDDITMLVVRRCVEQKVSLSKAIPKSLSEKSLNVMLNGAKQSEASRSHAAKPSTARQK